MIRLFLGLAVVAQPLHFDHLALGSVARVLSARYRTPITILANATTPVTGDFSQLPLLQALTLAARQAGLVVRADPTGYVIGPKESKIGEGSAGPPEPPVSPAERRVRLLRRRTELLQQAAKLTAP